MMKHKHVEHRERIAIITDVLRNHKGRMLTFKFVEKDGNIRKLNGRLGTYTDVKGSPAGEKASQTKSERGMINVKEIVPNRDERGIIRGNLKQWRTVNLNTLISVRMAHKELVAL